MTEIETLIPHRTPFLYVDTLTSYTKEKIEGTKIFTANDNFLVGSFPEYSFVPGVILIEALAQCGGAGVKKLGLADGLFGLANIENAEFFQGVPFGSIFCMVIRNIKIADKYIKQSGTGYVENQQCAELTWTCVKLQ